jgi:GT2 family glycosyltransferase
LNAGAAAASGDALLFLHADTTLPKGFADTVLGTLADPEVTLGAFAFSTDLRTATMRLFERGTNWRASRLGMPYGDQALFMRAPTFRALGGFPDLPLMEDYELALRARRSGAVRVAADAVVTSARAWREAGVWRSMLGNRLSVAAYRLGVAPEAIAGWRRSLRRPL